ncbi:expressed unknown protein [Seminavis robusta]|uniref:Uncharacterized protein n=1 Tax=Seminavis robusta TaxID=568900 RepID=A0A9N8EH65_9STRA|nr:expressed unknown protein [Seminavis robusta]|eukprot:Sro1186_g250290.1 n/a (305) ;mRNA; f:13541-14455
MRSPLAVVVLLVLWETSVGLSSSTTTNPKVDTTTSIMSKKWNRRDVFWHLATTATTTATTMTLLLPPFHQEARAIGEGEQRMVLREKPTAPIGALLPAIQQRLLLQAALELAQSSSQQQFEKLQTILPPLDDQSSKRGTSQDVRVLQQYNPAKVLRGDLIRACMNLYTTNLNYDKLLLQTARDDAAYTVTDPTWKKSYIRANDGLPDIQKVIGADLDLRYLYRNQVELKVEDAAAELYYASDNNNNIDREELISLLREATLAFDQWLDRIRYGDVRDALEAALSGKTTRVYDSWASGFLPSQPR